MKFLGEQEGDVSLSDLQGGRCGYCSRRRGLLVLCDAHLLLVTALFHPPFISSHTQPFRSSTHSQNTHTHTRGQTPCLKFVCVYVYLMDCHRQRPLWVTSLQSLVQNNLTFEKVGIHKLLKDLFVLPRHQIRHQIRHGLHGSSTWLCKSWQKKR